MKKYLFIITLLIGTLNVSAQNEVAGDTIRQTNTYNFKQFGEFILDMNILAPPPKLPSFSENLLGPDATKDYSALFRLPSDLIVSREYMQSGFHTGLGMFSGSESLQSATFKLGENARITTFGQYTLDGRRIPNPGALPWEKNNFKGGMELKMNKNFGFRIEVQHGRHTPYPY